VPWRDRWKALIFACISCGRPPPAIILDIDEAAAGLRALLRTPSGLEEEDIDGTRGGSEIDRIEGTRGVPSALDAFFWLLVGFSDVSV